MLFLALIVIFFGIALTRPGPNRLFDGRYRRHEKARLDLTAVEPTAEIHDPDPLHTRTKR